MKRYGFHVALVAIGVLLGALIAALSQRDSSAPAGDAPTMARQQTPASPGDTHFSAASPEGGATITEETKVDPAAENIQQLVPQRQETPWLKPVLMGVGALFLGALVIGVAARKAGIQDPGVAALEQDQKDAEFDEKHDEQPLEGPEAGNGGGSGHGHGGQAHH